eukprot:CAMPEP_0206438702 /NCGR_PEP_ID=MMETSP0324_2-20121206/11791_1 /ASSEMBLY_ACC=CAM_ASM_000836 /TAXON_ID=2866 /ORGANISM="Crypthecodinium cohnii, Strain Seligo" /LENGTH=54 /DNA_ID=CAMNT_0053906219 /DNA_START=219 /DNA_END=383 /DNA_ORIENTATION=+
MKRSSCEQLGMSQTLAAGCEDGLEWHGCQVSWHGEKRLEVMPQMTAAAEQRQHE